MKNEERNGGVDSRGETVEEKELQVYMRRKTVDSEVPHVPCLEASSSPLDRSNTKHSPNFIDESNLPIAIRKGVHSCTQHLISNYISYSALFFHTMLFLLLCLQCLSLIVC